MELSWQDCSKWTGAEKRPGVVVNIVMTPATMIAGIFQALTTYQVLCYTLFHELAPLIITVIRSYRYSHSKNKKLRLEKELDQSPIAFLHFYVLF